MYTIRLFSLPSTFGELLVLSVDSQLAWLSFVGEVSQEENLIQMQRQCRAFFENDSMPQIEEAVSFIQSEKNTDIAKQLENLLRILSNPKEKVRFSFIFPPQSTPFQMQVWQALSNIPCGKSISYKELASKIGKAEAVRAVGSAVGKNPISLLIPCHRVIHKDGTLSNYRWGRGLKAAILAQESEMK